MHVQSIVNVETGQDRKNVSLQERDQDLQPRQGYDQCERGDAADRQWEHKTGNNLDQSVFPF